MNEIALFCKKRGYFMDPLQFKLPNSKIDLNPHYAFGPAVRA
jgi:hypothetical protein